MGQFERTFRYISVEIQGLSSFAGWVIPLYMPCLPSSQAQLGISISRKGKSCFHAINKPLEQTSFLLALPKAPHAASFVLFTHSLAGKEQQHPFFSFQEDAEPRFQHAQSIPKHYRGAPRAHLPRH